MKIDLEHWQVRTLVTALEMTERVYHKYADTMEQCALAGGNDMLSAEACRNIKKTHETNAADTRAMIDLLDGNEGVTVEVPDPVEGPRQLSTHRASWRDEPDHSKRCTWVDERNGDVITFDVILSWYGETCVVDDVVAVPGAACSDTDRIPDDVIEQIRLDAERSAL